jgi:hypothetical protein
VWNALTEHANWKEFVAIDVVSWHGYNDVSPGLDIAAGSKHRENSNEPAS